MPLTQEAQERIEHRLKFYGRSDNHQGNNVVATYYKEDVEYLLKLISELDETNDSLHSIVQEFEENYSLRA